MSLLSYLGEYFETNHFTLHLVILLTGLSLWKYLRLSLRISPRVLLILFLLLGLGLRLGWAAFSSYAPRTEWNQFHMIESDNTNMHAIELTKGIWFHDGMGEAVARRPIGYPMFLGLLYKIFGVHFEVIVLSSLFLFAVTFFLVYGITKRVFDQKAALIAGLLYAIHPIAVYSVNMATDEHLFLPLWYGGLLLLLAEVAGKKIPFACLWYGLIFGYATMTRTNAVFMPLVVGWAYFLMRKSWRSVLLGVVSVFLVMQLVNLPWVIRNYKIWGQVITYTYTGDGLYKVVNSYATPEGSGRFPERGEPGFSEELEAAQKTDNIGVRHVLGSRLMTRWIASHPLEFLNFGSKRLLVFMGWDRSGGIWPIWYQYYEGSYDPARPIAQHTKDLLEETAFSFYYSLLFCFIFSMILIGRRWKVFSEPSRRGLLVVASCIFFWMAEHMIIFPDRKYRFPVEILMAMIAAFFLKHVLFDFRWDNIRWLPLRKKAV
ncbi:MAG: glycosyltransferase family 39 protein [Candidatus Omnitrophica bacterium]|nr:glycosyltransferase family 39 protein [Candidatus Omnitrophota bacterium]